MISFLPSFLPDVQPLSFFPSCLPFFLGSFLSSFLPSCLTSILFFLPFYLLSFLTSILLPSFLPACLPSFLSSSLRASCLPSFLLSCPRDPPGNYLPMPSNLYSAPSICWVSTVLTWKARATQLHQAEARKTFIAETCLLAFLLRRSRTKAGRFRTQTPRAPSIVAAIHRTIFFFSWIHATLCGCMTNPCGNICKPWTLTVRSQRGSAISIEEDSALHLENGKNGLYIGYANSKASKLNQKHLYHHKKSHGS